MYFEELLPRLAKEGDDGNYGSSALCDTNCLQVWMLYLGFTSSCLFFLNTSSCLQLSKFIVGSFHSAAASFHWLKKYVSDKAKIVYAHTRFFCCHNFARCHCCSTELMSIGDYSLFLVLPCRPSLEESIMGSL
jgi:hypothetical protein